MIHDILNHIESSCSFFLTVNLYNIKLVLEIFFKFKYSNIKESAESVFSNLIEFEVLIPAGNSEESPSVAINSVGLSEDPVAPRSQTMGRCSGSQVLEVLVNQNLWSLFRDLPHRQLDTQHSLVCSHLITELSSSNLREADHRLRRLVQCQPDLLHQTDRSQLRPLGPLLPV